MKSKDIRSLSVQDIESKIAEAKAEYATSKSGHKISPIENPIQIRNMRRNVARLNTILTEKLAEQK